MLCSAKKSNMEETTSQRVRVFLDSKEAEGSIKNLKDAMSGWKRELEKAEVGSKQYTDALKKIKDAEPILKQHTQALKGVGDAQAGWQKWAGMAGKIFAVGAIVEYGRAIFDLGKQMAEASFKAEALAKKAAVVLGDQLEKVTASAERNANQMGLTANEYVNATAAVADLLIPMGFTREAAADVSTEMVNLSGALSAWTGGQKSAKEVTDILADAMLGEREQLKGLGISISEADVDARLAEQGLSKLTGASRQQAEAAATLALITEKSADAQNNFALNSDTNAQKMQQLTARIAEMGEKIGAYLLPVFEYLLDSIDTVAEDLGSLFDYIDGLMGKEVKTTATDQVVQATKEEMAIKQAAATADAKRFAEEQERQKERQKEADRAAKQRKADREREAKQKQEEEAREAKRLADKAEADRLKKIEEENKLIADEVEYKKKAQAELDALDIEIEQEALDKKIADQQAEAEAKEQVRVALLTDRQLEIEEVMAHYDALLAIAEEYGLDTTELRAKQAAEIAKIEKKGADETAKITQENAAKRLAATQSMFQGLGELAQAGAALFAGEAGKSSRIGKVLTLAQIAFDTASAISSLTRNSEGNPANALTFGAAGIAQFATGLARILANIASARNVLRSAPTVEQKFMGGFTGATDGQTYQARYIGQQNTGMLAYDTPVVLANERGPEYYVDNASLRNPYILNHVQAIENLKGGAVTQFANGGMSMGAGSGELSAIIGQLQSVLGVLAQRLSSPIQAVIEDRTLVDMSTRSKKLTAAAGGTIQNSI
jgi:hypothetical protein